MDEEMKNAEQAANEVKNEAGSIFDQIKDMIGDAANDSAGMFDKLKGIFEGKEGEPGFFDKAKEMLDGKDGEAGVLDQVHYTGPSYEKALEWMKVAPGGKTQIWIGTWPRPEHTAADTERFEKFFEGKMDEIRANGFKGLSSVVLHTYYDPTAKEPFVPSTPYLKKIIAEFHAHDIPVFSIPFKGGDTEEVYFKLFEMGCDGYSTDYPSVMASAIRKLKAKYGPKK